MHKKKGALLHASRQNATTTTAVLMDITKSTPCTFIFDRITMHEAVLSTGTSISWHTNSGILSTAAIFWHIHYHCLQYTNLITSSFAPICNYLQTPIYRIACTIPSYTGIDLASLIPKTVSNMKASFKQFHDVAEVTTAPDTSTPDHTYSTPEEDSSYQVWDAPPFTVSC